MEFRLKLGPAEYASFMVAPQACHDDTSDDKTIQYRDRVTKNLNHVTLFLRIWEWAWRYSGRVYHCILAPTREFIQLSGINLIHENCSRATFTVSRMNRHFRCLMMLDILR